MNPEQSIQTPTEFQKRQIRVGVASATIALGVLSLLVAVLLPLLSDDTVIAGEVLFTVIFASILSVVYIAFGIIFLKVDKPWVAIVLIVLFAFYIIERIIIIILMDNMFIAVIWIVFAAGLIGSLVKYLKLGSFKLDSQVFPGLNTPPQHDFAGSQPQATESDVQAGQEQEKEQA